YKRERDWRAPPSRGSLARMGKQKADEAEGGPTKKAKSDETLRAFTARMDGLVSDIVEALPKGLPAETYSYIRKMCDYTCAGGKMTRGITVGNTFAAVLQSRGQTPTADELFRADVVGWCIEWLQACFLVLDDIMDDSSVRRGQPCWYKVPGVGKMAINDGLILESCMWILLKKHLKSVDAATYVAVTELFQEVSLKTQLGQLLDMTTEAEDGTLDFTRFTTERYTSIVLYKTAFYSFYLPVAAGLTLAGVSGEAELKQTEAICMGLGKYFQVTDDFLDCYGSPEVIGKVGTDIQDKKCSWLCVQALSKCTKEQRQIMQVIQLGVLAFCAHKRSPCGQGALARRGARLD
ncbi:MAG: FPP/GGPP synthase family protein, partial [Promethearchaeia archaeon]